MSEELGIYVLAKIGECSRPNLYSTFIRLVIADDMHICFGKFDDAFLLQLFDGLYNF